MTRTGRSPKLWNKSVWSVLVPSSGSGLSPNPSWIAAKPPSEDDVFFPFRGPGIRDPVLSWVQTLKTDSLKFNRILKSLVMKVRAWVAGQKGLLGQVHTISCRWPFQSYGCLCSAPGLPPIDPSLLVKIQKADSCSCWHLPVVTFAHFGWAKAHSQDCQKFRPKSFPRASTSWNHPRCSRYWRYWLLFQYPESPMILSLGSTTRAAHINFTISKEFMPLPFWGWDL